MFEDFLKELKLALQSQNIYYVQPIIDDYTKKFELLKTTGKTEFECVMALGDPEEIARTLVGQDYSIQDKLEHNMIESDQQPVSKSTSSKEKTPTMGGIICTDIFYMVPITIIAALGIIALAFLSGLVGFAGASYCILAWTTFSVLKEQILCFIMSLCGVLMFTGGAMLTLKLILAIINSIKEYRKERKHKLALIATMRGN